MFERFTDRARRVVVLAQEEARLLNHNYIGTEHVLLGLLHEGEGVAARALISLGVPLEDARQRVEQVIGSGQQPPSGHIPFTPRAKKVLELALREALALGHNYIGTEHILLGLVREGEGVAAQVLVTSGADLDSVRRRVTEILEAGTVEELGAAAPDWTARMVATEEVGPAEQETGPSSRAVTGVLKEPACPRCRAPLARTARTTTLDVAATEGEPRPIRLVFCSACGETLLAADP